MSECKSRLVKKEKKCPLCHEQGNSLYYMVVEAIVKEELMSLIRKQYYYICHSKDCDVIFYNDEEDQIFLTQDVNLGADFQAVTKQGSNQCGKGHHGNCHSCNNNNK
ncbi:hypothetical protein Amet_1219 [Alkaliphilus metalliredigens QYMF]|uniref:CopZ zinc binding domain-containing protein n=1 Tax=Alkaliphilus metalliredigens (strain QYMF) TaxID=293826 RepID=A6TMK9_ALKMQ|nr:hypothetical protein [Alkaliphilus metalliredigens]ABR47427.1 hypothetical protein Amet_1219 [Alkaliphilus metalliredigens QYMF]